ncbi:MAG: hypothetical protein O3C40_37705, partial [Planctomycetota bacterium]|nr:hypothetical protein [Planctomycetota bacterium]
GNPHGSIPSRPSVKKQIPISKPSAVATEPIEREGHGTITAVAQARVDAVFGSRKLSIARRLAALHAVAKDLDARIERRVNRRYEKWEQ